MTNLTLPIEMADPSRVGEARRVAVALARQLQFGETEAGKVGIVVTEAANNLMKHAEQGRLLLRGIEHGGVKGLEILSVDRGPGIEDVSRCMRDGYSTAGSPGTGLGAIARLSNFFDIHSLPGRGTVLLAQIFANDRGQEPRRFDQGAICVPMPGEESCGDAWSVRHEPGRSVFLVADGLGHGLLAARAAQAAVRLFEEKPNRNPAELIQLAHQALRSTRGASVAVAEFDYSTRLLRFAGIGNIAGVLVSDETQRNLVSHNGTVGHQMARVHEFTYPCPKAMLLVMHSDGLQSRWALQQYAGLVRRHPALISGVLYRDFRRVRDDVTVLVVREDERQLKSESRWM